MNAVNEKKIIELKKKIKAITDERTFLSVNQDEFEQVIAEEIIKLAKELRKEAYK